MAGTRLREPPAKQGLFQMLQQIRAPLRVGNKNNSEYFRNSRQLIISGKLRGDRTAVAAGIIAHGYAPALALCRKLIAAGVDPRTKLNLYRENGTLALTVRSIGEGAQLRIDGDGTHFERLPDGLQLGCPAAPPMRQNGPAAGAGWADWSPAPDDEGAP